MDDSIESMTVATKLELRKKAGVQLGSGHDLYMAMRLGELSGGSLEARGHAVAGRLRFVSSVKPAKVMYPQKEQGSEQTSAGTAVKN